MRMVELHWVFPERPKLVTEIWEWPAAVYRGLGMRHAAYLICEDQFNDAAARNGWHKPIHVILMKYNHPGQDPLKPRRMRYTDTQFPRLGAAMQWTEIFITQNPGWQPRLI